MTDDEQLLAYLAERQAENARRREACKAPITVIEVMTTLIVSVILAAWIFLLLRLLMMIGQ